MPIDDRPDYFQRVMGDNAVLVNPICWKAFRFHVCALVAAALVSLVFGPELLQWFFASPAQFIAKLPLDYNNFLDATGNARGAQSIWTFELLLIPIGLASPVWFFLKIRSLVSQSEKSKAVLLDEPFLNDGNLAVLGTFLILAAFAYFNFNSLLLSSSRGQFARNVVGFMVWIGVCCSAVTFMSYGSPYFILSAWAKMTRRTGK